MQLSGQRGAPAGRDSDVMRLGSKRVAIALALALLCATLASGQLAADAPVFINAGGHYVVVENAAAGTYIGDIVANSSSGAGVTLTYALRSGPGFALHSATGALTVASPLKQRDGAARTIVVEVSDGTSTVQASFTVIVASAAVAQAGMTGVSVETWSGLDGGDLSALARNSAYIAGTPSSTGTANTINLNHQGSNNYGQRYRAFLVPDVTGPYTFWVTADDAVEFRIGSDTAFTRLPATPSAYRWDWIWAYDWYDSPSQRSATMTLVRGQWYAVEVLFAQGGGLELVALAWQGPGGIAPVDGSQAAVVPAWAYRLPTVLPDITAPSTPSRLTVESVDATSVTLAWAAAADNVGGSGVVNYTITRNGAFLRTVAAPAPVTGALATSTAAVIVRFVDSVSSGIHTYTIAAVDAFGNVGPSIQQSGVTAGVAYNAIDAALVAGDAKLLTDPAIVVTRALGEISLAQAAQQALLSQLYPASGALDVSWAMTNNALMLMQPAVMAAHRVFAVLVANSCDSNPCSDRRTMAVAGTTARGTRFMAIGDSPFTAGYTAVMKRAIAWLTTGDGSAAALPANTYIGAATNSFTAIRTWMTTNGMLSTAAQMVDCRSVQPDRCLDADANNATDAAYAGSGKRTLLIMSAGMGSQDSNSPTLAASMLRLVARAEAEGVPILWINEADWGTRVTSDAVSAALGFAVGDVNAWYHGTVSYTAAQRSTMLADFSTELVGVSTLFNHLRNRDWDVDLTSCSTTGNCAPGPTAYLKSEFYAGARTFLRDRLTSIDSAGVRLFDTPSDAMRIHKLAVLAGDVYRRHVRFPLNHRLSGAPLVDWFTSYFADHVVYNVRNINPAQPDMGTFGRAPPADTPVFTEELVFPTRRDSYFTAAGVYVLPGRTVTITRLDTGSQGLAVAVNSLRPGSTQELDAPVRPKYLMTPWIAPPLNQPVNITNPYGGPMMLRLDQAASLTSIRVRVESVAKHPIWRSPADTAAFTAGLQKRDFNWAELITPGFQVHATTPLMIESMGSSFWSDPERLANFTYTNFYQVNYNLAGFVGEGLGISPQVRAICAANNWTAANGMACDESTVHGLFGMQHFNSDQANCGYGCSGNPYDAFWAFDITGWGDAHEMGHNLQSFNTMGKSGEASNNIYPVRTGTKWNLDHPSMFHHGAHSEYNLEWYIWLRDSNFAQADPGAYMRSTLWGDAATVITDPVTGESRELDKNDLKIAFLTQMACAAHASGMNGGLSFGQDGWDFFALMYIWERMRWRARDSASTWLARRAYLGMSTYAFDDSYTYEEQMLMAASWILRRDMRAHWDMWGVPYGAKAAAQLTANGFPAADKRFFYKPMHADGKVFWAALSVGSAQLAVGRSSLPKVPYVFFYTPEDARVLPARKPVALVAAVGANAGTVAFTDNGRIIRGCESVALAARTWSKRKDGSDDYSGFAAQCVWSPQTSGPHTLGISITVTQAGYESPSAAGINVTITDSPAAPMITAMSRTSGLAGSAVQLTGANFDFASAVTFNGVAATFTVDSSNQLSITVPDVIPTSVVGVWAVASSTGYIAYSDEFVIRKAVTGVAIMPAAAFLNRGQLRSLTAQIVPSFATNTDVYWTVADALIATVDGAGIVNAGSSIGRTSATVRTSDGGFTSVSNISIVADPVALALRVTPSSASYAVDVGASITASATVLPAGVSSSLVRWSVDDTAVASVDAGTGIVRGISVGATTLRVTSADGAASATASLQVQPAVTGNDASNTLGGLAVGMEYSVENQRNWIAYTGSNGPSAAWLAGNIIVHVRLASKPTIVKSITFTSGSDATNYPLSQKLPGVTYLSDLTLTNIENGWDRVAYDLGNGGDKVITVRGTGGASVTYAKGMGVHADGSLTVQLGGRFALFRSVVGNDLAASSEGSVRFFVIADGRSVFADTTAVTTSMPARTIEIDVTGVNQLVLRVDDGGNGNGNDAACWAGAHFVPVVTSVTVSPAAAQLLPTASVALSASVVAAAGASSAVTWETSDATVATVSASGTVTAVAAGTATITARSSVGGVAGTTVIRVVAPSVTELTVAPTSLSLSLTGTTTATVTASVRADAGAAAAVAWSSSDPAVATVSSDGVVTAVGAGYAVVTASAGSGSFRAATAVRVTGASPTAPNPPTGITLKPGASGALVVSWTAPAYDGGSALTGFTATTQPGGATCSGAASAASCTITGLTNGASYTVSVVATNAVGASAAATPPSNAATAPRTIPSAPTGVSGTRSNAAAVVSWSAPASDGGATVTGYTVTASPGGRTCTTLSAAPTAAPRACTVTGLSNGVAYTFSVVASNDAGAGPASASSAAVTPLAPPNAPASVTAAGRNGAIQVSWTAPAFDGGSAITGYSAFAAPGTASCSAAAAARSCDITGLTNGIAYTVSVSATSAVGTGPVATAAAAVIPQSVPAAPTSVRGVAGDTNVTVMWTAPVDVGGASITGFEVTSSDGASKCATSGTQPAQQCTIFGLTNLVAYTFTVRARNAAGLGASSAASDPATPLPDGMVLPSVTPSVAPSAAATPSATGSAPPTPTATSSSSVTPSSSPTASVSTSLAASPSATASPLLGPDAAVATGMSSYASGAQLRAALRAAIATADSLGSTIRSAIFANIASASLSWDPSHDSALLGIDDAGSAAAILRGNWMYKGGATNERPLLGAAGLSQGGAGGRFAAFGGNPIILAAGNAVLATYLRGTITWLNGGTDPASAGSGFKIVTANIPGASSYWFQHDVPTRAWLASSYPSANINTNNACDNAALANCLATANLLVLSCQVSGSDDSASANWPASAAAVGAAVGPAVKAFLARGGAVLYVHYYRDANAITDAVFPELGIRYVDNNYWSEFGVKDSDVTTAASADGSAGGVTLSGALTSILDTLTGATPLSAGDLSACQADGASTWASCATGSYAPGFAAKIGAPALMLRDTLRAIDRSGGNLFALPGRTTLKLAVLLGDKYRANNTADAGTTPLNVPFRGTDAAAFAGAVFADSSILYRRVGTPAQDSLGTLYCPRSILYARGCGSDAYDHRKWSSRASVLSSIESTASVPIDDGWTTTGLFALPGRTITVERLDSGAREAGIMFFFHRESTTKARQVDGATGWSLYDRPQFVQSTVIKIVAGAPAANVTTPHGGPIYLWRAGAGSAAVAATEPGVRLRFTGVAQHPAILDINDDAAVTAFVATAATNPIPMVDLRAEGFEVHMRRDKLLDSLAAPLTLLQDYTAPGAAGMRALLDDFKYNFVEAVYSLAGFKLPGKPLASTISPILASACSGLGWNCIDETVHIRTSTQHSNYDDNAACGDGCSGNPWDAAWNIVPLGWGESHELGHNLQRRDIKIHYIPSSASAGARDTWSSYLDRSGENSNNIFPYYVMWRYYRRVRGFSGDLADDHMDHAEAFAVLQSAQARVVRNGALTIFKAPTGAACTDASLQRAFDVATTSAVAASETIYADGSYAADNGMRMSFFLQLPLLLANTTLRDGVTRLDHGYEIFSLLYVAARLKDVYGATDALWTANREALGLGVFPRTGHATYGSGDVRNIPGNDFMLCVLSRITGRDWRPFWDVRGLPYSSLASAQVDAFVSAGIVNSTVAREFVVLSTDLPQASYANLPRVPLDGVASWPRTGWAPANCAPGASPSPSAAATPSRTASPIPASATATRTGSGTPTATSAASTAASASSTAAATGTGTGTTTGTASASNSQTGTASGTPTGTASPGSSASQTASGTASASLAPSASGSPSSAASLSASSTGASSASGSPTSSATVGSSSSQTATASASTSLAATASSSPTASATQSSSGTVTATGTASASNSQTGTASGTPTGTASTGSSASQTASGTASASLAPSASGSPSTAASLSASATGASSATGTPTSSVSVGSSPSQTGTASASTSLAPTGSDTSTASTTQSGSGTVTATGTASTSGTATGTASGTASVSVGSSSSQTASASGSSSMAPTASGSSSAAPTPSNSATGTGSGSISPTTTATSSAAVTQTRSASATASLGSSQSSTLTGTATVSVSLSGSSTATATSTVSISFTSSQTASTTATASQTRSQTPTISGTLTSLPSRSPAATPTSSRTETPAPPSPGASPSSSPLPVVYNVEVSVTLAVSGIDTADVTNSSSPVYQALCRSIATSAGVPADAVSLELANSRRMRRLQGGGSSSGRTELNAIISAAVSSLLASPAPGGGGGGGAPMDFGDLANAIGAAIAASVEASVASGALFNSSDFTDALVAAGVPPELVTAAVLATTTAVLVQVIQPSPPPQPSTSSQPIGGTPAAGGATPGSSGLSGGAVAGIIIGVLAAVAVVFAATVVHARHSAAARLKAYAPPVLATVPGSADASAVSAAAPEQAAAATVESTVSAAAAASAAGPSSASTSPGEAAKPGSEPAAAAVEAQAVNIDVQAEPSLVSVSGVPASVAYAV